MNRPEIGVSDRCFFPKSAFQSSEKTVQTAMDLGYQSVELHPTWAVWWEVITKGKLKYLGDKISSFHISWREDGQNYWQGTWLGRITYPPYNLFPFEPLATKTLQKLESIYHKPVVIHWPSDIGRYQQALLELHRLLTMNLEQINQAIDSGEITGVLIDTDKFNGWLVRHKQKERKTLDQLFPHIKEVHFRFRNQEDYQALIGKGESRSTQLMEKLVKLGYQGRVMVEMGWPDQGSVESLKKVGFERVHADIIGWLKSA